LPYDPYEDPEITDNAAGFPLTVKFEEFGDRVRGVVVDIERWDPPPRKPKETPQPILKYKLAECVVSQRGKQTKEDQAELLAGAKNLKGQLLSVKPRLGDEIDITFTSTSKSSFGSDTKYFKVVVTDPEGRVREPEPEPEAQPQPLRAVSGDDLFNDRR
jgi:hypothetical protein